MHSNEVPAFYLTHYTTMFDTVMSGSVCYLRIISKGIPTPRVKRQRQTGSIGMHCETPLMLENQSPPSPIFKRQNVFQWDPS